MKKLILVLMLSVGLFAFNPFPQGPQGPPGVQGIQGVPGSDGINGSNGQDYQGLENKLRASTVALSSVELNPDHKGLSLGLGVSTNRSENAAALGVMYGTKVGDNSVGFNVKAYKAEGGYDGFGAGVTIGF